MLTFGASAFVWALVPRASAQALVGAVERRAIAAGVLVALTALAWLVLQAGEMGGDAAEMLDPRTIADVLFDTAFGAAWQVHLVLAAGLIGVCLFARADRLGATTILSGLLLGSLGLVGHAAMRPGTLGLMQRGNHAIHLLAAGAWVGSLVPLLSVMGALRSPQHRRDATLALVRFSAAGHWVVVLVLLTGIGDTLLVVGSRPPLPSLPYAGPLLGKLAIVACMVGIALLNRYRLVPSMGRSPAEVRTLLARNTLAVLVLGGVVLAISVVLGSIDPG